MDYQMIDPDEVAAVMLDDQARAEDVVALGQQIEVERVSAAAASDPDDESVADLLRAAKASADVETVKAAASFEASRLRPGDLVDTRRHALEQFLTDQERTAVRSRRLAELQRSRAGALPEQAQEGELTQAAQNEKIADLAEKACGIIGAHLAALTTPPAVP